MAELASLSEPAGAFSSSVSEMDCDVLLVDPFARRSLSHSLSLSLTLSHSLSFSFFEFANSQPRRAKIVNG